MPSLKIALLSYRSDPYSGGQGIYIKNLSEALHDRGHEITIFSGNPLPDVSKAIKVEKIETPGFFETFDSLERLKIFSSLEKNRLNFLDFFETFTGTFTEPVFFGERLVNNKFFQESVDEFDIFHDNQSISSYPETVLKKLVTTLHHPIHVDKEIDLASEKNKLEILKPLNSELHTTFSAKDVWTSSTTVSNQWIYWRNHLTLFESAVDLSEVSRQNTVYLRSF